MDNMFLHLRNGQRGGGCSEQYDLFSIFGSLFDAAYLLPGLPRLTKIQTLYSFHLFDFLLLSFGSSQLSSNFTSYTRIFRIGLASKSGGLLIIRH